MITKNDMTEYIFMYLTGILKIITMFIYRCIEIFKYITCTGKYLFVPFN